MTRRLRLSSLADDDVASIAEFIARDNLDAALRLVDRFDEVFQLLAAQPGMGEVYRSATRELRRFSVGTYLVFYQTLEDEVVIARVIHGARSWEDLV